MDLVVRISLFWLCLLAELVSAWSFWRDIGSLASMTRPPLPAALPESDRTRHRRLREQGSLDRADLDAILDAGFICHLGVVVEGRPLVVPTVYGRDEGQLFVHGSVASRSLAEAAPVCVTVTHVDGLVLARSVFEHGVNYRSAMIHGVPRKVTDPAEKLEGLQRLTEHATPGQWDYARRPSRKELAATTLLALSLEEASVKIRTGAPDDGDGPDAELGLWAGTLPLAAVWGAPVPDPALAPDIAAPEHVVRRKGTRHG